MPRFFVDSLGEIVFKLRLMLKGTLIFLELNRIYSVLPGFTEFVSYHPRKNILNARFYGRKSRSQFRRDK